MHLNYNFIIMLFLTLSLKVTFSFNFLFFQKLHMLKIVFECRVINIKIHDIDLMKWLTW